MAKRTRRSAGILLYRSANGGIEILIAHPRRPVWAKQDDDTWSVDPGEIEEGEDPWDVARREFEEETGHPAPDGASIELGEITQKGGKVVVPGRSKATSTRPRPRATPLPVAAGSGRYITVQIDRVEWFSPDDARPHLTTRHTRSSTGFSRRSAVPDTEWRRRVSRHER